MRKKYIVILAALVAFALGASLVAAKQRFIFDTREAQEREFHGEGTIVAVIDSGADIEHPDLQTLESDYVKLKRDAVEKIIEEKGLPGRYVSDKIIYVHDYCQGDNDIYSRDEHGMHVAGIIGANGEVKGIAPEAQLILMKVFPDEGIEKAPDSDDFYVQAIRDALLLQADVINLSLGSGAGSMQLLNANVQAAIREAEAKGVAVNVAAGNSGYYGFMAAFPKAENPDYGVISMPAVMPEALAVASVDGEAMQDSMLYVGDTFIPYREAYRDSLSLADALPYGTPVPVVPVGYGGEADYDGKDVDSAIALCQKGRYDYFDLQHEARKHGCLGLLIYNSEEETNELTSLDGTAFSLPMAFLRHSDGAKLVERLTANPQETIVFMNEAMSYPNPNSGRMSPFSAWGLSNDGLLKPDVSAPGGNILSLANQASYVEMSGTSMATPHISGAMALIAQRLNESYPQTLLPAERLRMMKRLLLSTARPHEFGGQITSPRKQGAGVLDLRGALSGQVLAYSGDHAISFFAGDVDSHLEIPVTLENISNKPLSLSASYVLLADTVENGRYTLESQTLKEDTLGKIQLRPRERKDLSYTLDIRGVDLSGDMPNGYFLDGYLLFSNEEDKAGASLAFSAFKGDYEELPILEEPIYQIRDFDATYMDRLGYSNDFTHLGSSLRVQDEDKHIVLGETPDSVIGKRQFTNEHLAFSPNKDNRADDLEFVFTALRTYEKIAIDIYDADGHLVETYAKVKEPYMLKNYFGGKMSNDKALVLWTYKPTDEIEDGQYKAVVKARRYFTDSWEQEISYDFRIDRIPPELRDVSLANGVLRFRAEDTGSGVRSVQVRAAGKLLTAEADGRYNVGSARPSQIEILVTDHAYNQIKKHP